MPKWFLEHLPDLRKGAVLGGLNALSYFILTIDFRAVAQANIAWALSVNLIIPWLGWTIFKRMQEAATLHERILYTLGGATGTYLGIKFTLFDHILGH